MKLIHKDREGKVRICGCFVHYAEYLMPGLLRIFQ